MSNLVKTLRGDCGAGCNCLFCQAADEIECLHDELERANNDVDSEIARFEQYNLRLFRMLKEKSDRILGLIEEVRLLRTKRKDPAPLDHERHENGGSRAE